MGAVTSGLSPFSPGGSGSLTNNGGLGTMAGPANNLGNSLSGGAGGMTGGDATVYPWFKNGGLGGSLQGGTPTSIVGGHWMGNNGFLNGLSNKLSAAGSPTSGAQYPVGLNPNVVNPTNAGQLGGAQGQVGNSLASQQALIAALQGANGIGNQGQVFNQGQSLAGQLGRANGIGTQQVGIQGLQNVLAQQQGIANGTGPNPAQAMLNQATGQNVANQAALMAGQRGAGANVGLMARQAAQQGANTQQQAAGQAATMQAQQQLNALNAMQGTNQALVGAGQGLTAQQQAQLNANAGIANNQVANQLGATTAGTQGSLAAQQNLLGAQNVYNQAITSGQNSVNAANAAMNLGKQQGMQNILGGAMNGAGPVLAGIGSMFAGGAGGGAGAAGGAAGADTTESMIEDTFAGYAKGGKVKKKKMADGGDPSIPDATPPIAAAPQTAPAAATSPTGPVSAFGQFLKGWNDASGSQNQDQSKNSGPFNMGGNQAQQNLQKGSQSMTTGLISGLQSAFGANGGLADKGGHVAAKTPAQKATKPGNDYKNDKIDATLSEHEIVLPRSVTMSDDPAGNAAKFVAQVIAKRKAK